MPSTPLTELIPTLKIAIAPVIMISGVGLLLLADLPRDLAHHVHHGYSTFPQSAETEVDASAGAVSEN